MSPPRLTSIAVSGYRWFIVGELHWRPGIGDPSFMGWLTVFAYLLVGWLCLRAFMVEKSGKPRPYRQAIPALLRVLKRHWPRPPGPARRAALWLVMGSLLFALGVNKQLDLQSLVTDLGRVLAHDQGWYQQRRTVQIAFIAIVGLIGAIGLGGVVWLARGQLADFRLALGGMVFLCAFVLARASSFHHVDILIHTEFVGVQLNWLFELTGIVLVGVAAGRRLWKAKVPLFWNWTLE
jgi:hypothetical protein